MKKLLFTCILVSSCSALLGMEDIKFTKNTCNYSYNYGRQMPDLKEWGTGKIECAMSRIEVFHKERKEYIGAIAYRTKNDTPKKDELLASDTCQIHFFKVAKEYRKQGIGSNLFFQVLEDMQKSGCKQARVYSELEAWKFYKTQLEKSKYPFKTNYRTFIIFLDKSNQEQK